MTFMGSHHFLTHKSLQRMASVIYSQIIITIRCMPVTCCITHVYHILFWLCRINANKGP